jgi:prepilin-type N-terminal cleavage/methylation domain-containing protein
MNVTRKEKGFTIIEVVLVLAIAGLIFLMVFLAFPAVTRSQHDTTRKTDLGKISTQITSYISNNRGAIPASLITTTGGGSKSFVQNYLAGTAPSVAGPDFVDPSTGNGYTFLAAGTAPSVVGQVGYQPSAICGVDGSTTGGTSRQYALTIFLESQSTPFCVDNH